MAVAVDMVQSLAAKFSVLLPHLDERQQRLYLASEARSLGHGGIAAVGRGGGEPADGGGWGGGTGVWAGAVRTNPSGRWWP